MQDLITQYVLARGLIEPSTDSAKEILDNELLLAEIAGLWRDHKAAIEALVKARIYPIQRELLTEATPAEVIILRQAMLEVAFFYDDFARYAAEWERREEERKREGRPATDPDEGASI